MLLSLAAALLLSVPPYSSVPASLARLAQEQTQPELLPPPKIASPERVITEESYLMLRYLRRSKYDVWQYYGVDPTGHFRARVIYSPCGSFYLYNGEPYPWTATHQRDFIRYVVD